MEQPKHIDKQTPNGAQLNLDALYKIVPSCFTEAKGEDGEVRRVVDFNKLRLLLGDNAVEDAPEVYDFTWVGKRAAQHEAMAPCRKTLRPCPEESVNWDTTQNLYIEGDNLEVLKLLQNSYMGKVKMIYIDPPYNTGNDFLYKDTRSLSAQDYNECILDDEGNRLIKNTYSNGSFHSDWCSMIYERLVVSRPLLSDDGVIFISIDDNELRNLRNICDEVLGEQNFITVIPRIAKKGSDQGTHFRPTKDYILCYAKNFGSLKGFVDKNLVEKKNYPYNESGRKYRKAHSLFQASLDPLRGCINQRYYIKAPDGTLIIPPGDNFPSEKTDGGQISPQTKNDKVWRWSKDSYMSKKSIIMFDKSQRSPLVDSFGNHTDWNVYEKKYEDEETKEEKAPLPNDVIYDFINTLGTTTLHELGLEFSFSKPYQLIKYIITIIDKEDDILILDFFSGSATTAHAVMELNAEDQGNRRYIMVQVKEDLPEGTPDFKTIPEIAKERIRRAGKKIKEEHPEAKDLDIGFRVFKCESSNYKDVAFAPKDYNQAQLDLFEDNIKEDRTDLDLLFDCMLRWGVTLDLPMTKTKVDGCTIHNVNEGGLVACFDGKVTEQVINAIAEMYPVRVVFRDSSFEEAAQKMNLFELFKQKCGWTEQEVRNNVRVI
ncbi:MAG: site-specific DNA-methyltransferase [Prevotella sp.]|nr:site-specific DNA-methyltransferase [Prevotella sp.]